MMRRGAYLPKTKLPSEHWRRQLDGLGSTQRRDPCSGRHFPTLLLWLSALGHKPSQAMWAEASDSRSQDGR
jgi:hypothetical protein